METTKCRVSLIIMSVTRVGWEDNNRKPCHMLGFGQLLKYKTV